MLQPERPQPDRLETLSAISRALSATLDLPSLCETIDREIGRVMDTTLFSIAILDSLDGLGSGQDETLWLPYVREEGRLFTDERLPYGDNVSSVVIREGQPLLFATHREYRRFADTRGLPVLNVGEDQGEAVMFVPLHTGTRCVGVLSVESFEPNAYSYEDLETLSIIAAQAAVAIENAELFARSQQSVRQMAALLRVTQAINGSLDLPTLLDAVLMSMQEVIPYAYAALLLPNEAKGTLDIMDSVGPDRGRRETDEPAPRTHLHPSHPLRATLHIPLGEGISGAVYLSGQPLVVSDVRTFPGFVDHELSGVLSEMAVPLLRDDGPDPSSRRVVGVLDLGREGTGAFREDEVDVVALFAAQAVVALENARLFEQQRQRVEELQAIQTIVQRLQPLHEPVAIAQFIVDELKRLIDYSACHLYEMDQEHQTLTTIHIAGQPVSSTDQPISSTDRPISSTDRPISSTDRPISSEAEKTGETAPVPDQTFAQWIAREGIADRIANTMTDPRTQRVPRTLAVEESMVGAPLLYEGQVRGVMTLSKLGRDQFDENDLRVLQIIAAQVAIAFDRARLYHELHTEARTDGLVRLWNRRYLLERFREERSRAARTGRPLSAIMIDIDKFKSVNDTYGHDVGDVVLREVADVIRTGTRAEDIVARYGGEEFLALLPECPLAHAEKLARRICEAVADHVLPDDAGIRHVTVSVGVAIWKSSDTGEELFSRADTAMYHAKVQGGNSIAVSRP